MNRKRIQVLLCAVAALGIAVVSGCGGGGGGGGGSSTTTGTSGATGTVSGTAQ